MVQFALHHTYTQIKSYLNGGEYIKPPSVQSAL